MRTVWQATAFLLVVIIISLLYKLPAKFVYRQFAANSPVELVGISGSVWSGHVEQINIRQISIGDIDWTLSPFALLFGEASIQWQSSDPVVMLSGELLLSSDVISVTNTHGSIDLLAIAQRFPSQDLLPDGIINIKIDAIDLDQEKFLKVKGHINWKKAGMIAPEIISFGGFNAELTSRNGQLLMQLSDADGAVSLSGNVMFTRYGEFQYSIKLGVRDISQPALLEGFKQLGRPDIDGNISMQAGGYLF